jgi:phenylalanine-4-hydroxylase
MSSSSSTTDILRPRVTAIFSVCDGVGALDAILQVFKSHNISLTRIESRPSIHRPQHDYDFFVDFEGGVSAALRKELELKSARLLILEQKQTAVSGGAAWFPRKISDLDVYANKILAAGSDLQSDHPGFQDAVYRARRAHLAQLALDYRHGQAIPHVQYTADEVSVWADVYTRLKQLYPTHACKQFRQVLPLLEKHCGYGTHSVPQLDDVSRFLQDCTGFRLRPVGGLLSSRDFLNGLAFRVFHSTQYLRHHTRPFYTPEPDAVHELLGHVPLFADRDFADFSQAIGLASLGASDDFIDQLATVYWFTVEFGLCREDGQLKAYGAGLLSSFGELEYALGDKPKLLPFDPHVTGKTKYPITEYQPTYFVAESFADATRLVHEFADKSDRPFAVRYNALTQSVDVLDSIDKLVRVCDDLQTQVGTLAQALRSMRPSGSN